MWKWDTHAATFVCSLRKTTKYQYRSKIGSQGLSAPQLPIGAHCPGWRLMQNPASAFLLQSCTYALLPNTFLNGDFLVDNYVAKTHPICLKQTLKTTLSLYNSILNEKKMNQVLLWREIYHREGLLKIFGSRGIKKGVERNFSRRIISLTVS